MLIKKIPYCYFVHVPFILKHFCTAKKIKETYIPYTYTYKLYITLKKAIIPLKLPK